MQRSWRYPVALHGDANSTSHRAGPAPVYSVVVCDVCAGTRHGFESQTAPHLGGRDWDVGERLAH